MNKKIYLINHNKVLDKIITINRVEILNLIKNLIKNCKIKDVLDIGTTNDEENKSSNFIIKNLCKSFNCKSISNQFINSKIFRKKLKKSITGNFSKREIEDFKSDLVISSATIEHVGSNKNQTIMIDNIIKLSKKIFILTTPNKLHPVEFHTKIPFIHWLPKKIYRKLLKLISYSFFSKEENLNLLSENDLNKILQKFSKKIIYKIYSIKLFGIKSNIIIFGKII
jgi:hypothetical protein